MHYEYLYSLSLYSDTASYLDEQLGKRFQKISCLHIRFIICSFFEKIGEKMIFKATNEYHNLVRIFAYFQSRASLQNYPYNEIRNSNNATSLKLRFTYTILNKIQLRETKRPHLNFKFSTCIVSAPSCSIEHLLHFERIRTFIHTFSVAAKAFDERGSTSFI